MTRARRDDGGTTNGAAAARLRWRCRRGVREMDLLLLRFLEQVFPGLDEPARRRFDAMLDEADADLYDWITGRAAPPPAYRGLLRRMRETTRTSPPGGRQRRDLASSESCMT